MTRGPKLGTYRPESFVGKLMTLRVGEALIFPDKLKAGGPTLYERNLQTQLIRSAALAERKFTTQRTRYILGDRLAPGLIITREA